MLGVSNSKKRVYNEARSDLIRAFMKHKLGTNGLVWKNGLMITAVMKTGWSAASQCFSRLCKMAVHPVASSASRATSAWYHMIRYPKVKRTMLRQQCVT